MYPNGEGTTAGEFAHAVIAGAEPEHLGRTAREDSVAGQDEIGVDAAPDKAPTVSPTSEVTNERPSWWGVDPLASTRVAPASLRSAEDQAEIASRSCRTLFVIVQSWLRCSGNPKTDRRI